jgi:hypothetical protein
MRLGGSPPASLQIPTTAPAQRTPPQTGSSHRPRRHQIATQPQARLIIVRWLDNPITLPFFPSRHLSSPHRRDCLLLLFALPTSHPFPFGVDQPPFSPYFGEERLSTSNHFRLPVFSANSLPSATHCLKSFTLPHRPPATTAECLTAPQTFSRFSAASLATCMLRTVGKPKILMKPSLALWSKVLTFS